MTPIQPEQWVPHPLRLVQRVGYRAKRDRLPSIRLGILLLALIPATAHSQGCPQCKDSTAATPPATQSAYREAILFLAGAAATVFLATLVILKRHR